MMAVLFGEAPDAEGWIKVTMIQYKMDSHENGYTINAAGVKPTQVIWLDTAAAGSNSGGTAQITNVQEAV